MRKSICGILAAVCVAAGGPAQDAHAGGRDSLPKRLLQPISVAQPDQSLFDEAVLIFSNVARRQFGKKPLRTDPRLARAAADHARNMADLKTHAHQLPVRGQGQLVQRMDRQAVRYRTAAENIAIDKVYRVLGRQISARNQGCRFLYADTNQPVPVHSYASLAEQVVARWMASPKHRQSLLSPAFGRLGSGVGVDPGGTACGDFYLVQNFAD